MEFSSEKNAEIFSLTVLQKFCSKSENQNKRLIFQKRVAKNVLQETQLVVLNCTRSHSTKLKKKSIVQFLVFFQNVPLHRGSRCDNSTQCFLLRVKTWWKPENCFIQSTFSSKCSIGDDKCWLDNPANIVWSCDKVSHNVWKRQKTLIFCKKYHFLTLFHWTLKSSLKIVPQGFRSNSKRSNLYENFQRVVFSKKFLWTRKRHFWQAPRKFCLPKVTLSHRSKSGKNEWYLNFP